MFVRGYQMSDCKEITELFYNTVHTINAKDYTKEQLDVWATGQADLEKWNQSLQEHYSIVAIDNKIIVGFGDIDKDGYLDRLFVHSNYQGTILGSGIRLFEKADHEIKLRLLKTQSYNGMMDLIYAKR